MCFLKSVVSRPWIQFVKAADIRGTLGTNPEPFLIHVIIPVYKVVVISAIGPGSIDVVLVGKFSIVETELPPSVAELECEAADRVSGTTHSGSIGVDLPPVLYHVIRLRALVFHKADSIESIRSELGKHQRLVQFLLNNLEHIPERRSPIRIGSINIHILAFLCDDIYKEYIPVTDGHRVGIVDGFHKL